MHTELDAPAGRPRDFVLSLLPCPVVARCLCSSDLHYLPQPLSSFKYIRAAPKLVLNLGPLQLL